MPRVDRQARDRFLRRVSSIGVWRRGDQRAPHKPLLFLLALAKVLRGEPRLQPFTEYEIRLAELLKKYGPPRRAVHSEYPFWWLQSDGLWEVPHGSSLERRTGHRDPTRRALRNGVVGGFDEATYVLLRDNRTVAAQAASALLRDHFPTSLHEEILTDAELPDLDVAAAWVRDALFRQQVLQAYEHRCAVCGFDVRLGDGIDLALEAAHVKWHQAGGPDVVQNGLALCAIHHKALDLGAISVDSRRHVVVSAAIYGQAGMSRWFLRYHRRPLRTPHSESLSLDSAFLGWHRREVFRSPARD